MATHLQEGGADWHRSFVVLIFRYMNIWERRHCINQVNKCLGIHLFPWQIKYIFGINFDVPTARGTGKTLAHMLRVMLASGPAIDVRTPNSYEASLVSDYDMNGVTAVNDVPRVMYNRQYLWNFRKIYTKLKKETNVPLREITIHLR